MFCQSISRRIYSGSHSDEIQASCPRLLTPMLFPAEVYLMRSGTSIEPYRHIGASMKRFIESLLPLVDILDLLQIKLPQLS